MRDTSHSAADPALAATPAASTKVAGFDHATNAQTSWDTAMDAKKYSRRQPIAPVHGRDREVNHRRANGGDRGALNRPGMPGDSGLTGAVQSET